jgi:hypothetical protein
MGIGCWMLRVGCWDLGMFCEWCGMLARLELLIFKGFYIKNQGKRQFLGITVITYYFTKLLF